MHSFESKLLTTLKPFQFLEDALHFVCVSGGKDSVALFVALQKLKRALKLQSIAVVYIHHGESESSEQNEFRNKANKFVLKLSEQYGATFFQAPIDPQKKLQSEADFRDYRYKCFESMLRNHPNSYFWLGHHQDDQLETRLIRLIRGTGPKGIESMQVLSEQYVRPFLEFSSNEVQQYLEQMGQSWLEDPSNNSDQYFRNWIRNSWLPDLESFKPGAVKRLAESLEQISQFSDAKTIKVSLFIDSQGIDRVKFRELSRPEQKQVLAHFCRSKDIKNYTQGQFNELLKHLDRDENISTLDIMKSRWTFDAKHISVLFKKQD